MKRISVPIKEDERLLLRLAAQYRGISSAALARQYIETAIAAEIVEGVLG